MKKFLFFLLLISTITYSQNQNLRFICLAKTNNQTGMRRSTNLNIFDNSNVNIASFNSYNFNINKNKFDSISCNRNQFNLHLSFSGGATGATSSTPSCSSGDIFTNGSYFLTEKNYSVQPTIDNNFLNYTDGEFLHGYCSADVFLIPLTINNLSVITQGKCNDIVLPSYKYEEELTTIGGSLSNNYNFSWQYKVGNTGAWMPLSETYYDNIVDFNYKFKSEDLAGLSNYTGILNFRFKIVPLNTQSVMQPFYSDIIPFEIKYCAPKIVGQPVVSNLKCYDGANGSVSVIFDRSLQNNEKTRIDLYSTQTGIVNNIYVYPFGFTLPVDGEININLNSNNQFTINNLSRLELPQNYYFNYQSIIGGQFTTLETGSTFNITAPTPVIFSTTINENVKCFGAATGKITVTASGGTGNLRYSKDGGATWQTTNVFTGLAAGNYPILVKDINSTTDCIAPAGIQNVTITQPTAALSITLDSYQDVYLANTTDPLQQGYINTTVTGGTAPYTYVWKKNGVVITNSNSSPEDLVDLNNPTGIYTYSLTVTDANLCTFTLNQQIISPDPITATFTVNQIQCFEGTGAIVATVTGGNAGAYSYAWSNSTATTSTIGNLNAGSYTLTVTDSKGVVATFPSQTINPAPSIIFIGGLNPVQQLCAGDNSTNIIDITPSGGTGTGTYTYRWYDSSTPPNLLSTAEDLTNVSPGSYTVFVKDANLCEKDKTFVINPATPIAVISTITNILNPGTSSGSINLTVSGGTGTYSFLWSNGTTSQNLSPAAAGTYSVIVTDSNLCVFNSPIYTITSPPAFVVSISQTAPVLCNGESTAALSVTATGGTPNATLPLYSYSWLNNTSTSNSISGLSAGTYTVEVRDFNNIPRTASFTITEPTLLDASFAKTNVTCNGANNGTITVTPTGGTSTYKYKFTGETVFTSSNSRTGLAPGTYSCEVKDFNGCSKIINNIIITQPSVLSIASSNITPVSVLGASDGQINISVIGGTSTILTPYTYSWTGTTNTTNNPTGLQAGFYTVTVTDNNGCSILATYEVTLILPLTATINQTQQISCFGGSNANLVVVPSGGRPPYTYLWSSGATSNTLSNLAVGNYSVIVRDSNTPQSTFTATYNVTQPATAISASITAQTNVSCFGNATGTATVAGAGGTGTYTYSWTNSSNATIGTPTATIPGLIAGTYYCKVKDANLCETTKTVIITQPSAALTSNLVSSTNVNINGQSTGAITINVTGGTSPYTFAWSNGATSQNLSNIPAGIYSVTITDSKGCTTSINSILITQPNVLNCLVSQTTPNSIQCNGDNTGSLTASTTGGTGAYAYVWRKNGIQVGITNPINNLTAGTYEVTVSDNFTSTVVSYTLNQPTVLSGTFTSIAASCNGGANGSITINPTGGTPPYTYSWFNGSTAPTQNGLSAGNYVVSIKDANNCDTGLLSGTIQPGGGINLNAVVVNGACNSNSFGSISFAPSRANGSTNGFSISWSNPSFTGFTQNNLLPATYAGSITDTVNACVIPFSYTITGATPIVVNLGNDVMLCNGQSIEIDGTNTGNGLSYSWSSTNGFNSTNPKVTLSLAGTYTLSVTTSGNCVYSDSIIITSSGQSIDSNYLVASQTYKNEEIILINVSDKTNTTYSWVFPAAAQIISQNQDTAIIKFANAGIYNIGLRGINSVGCIMTDYNELVIETNTNNVVNTNNNILIKKFNISPNPILSTSNLFNLEVELAFELPLTVSIYSISGGALINEITLPPSKIHNKQYDFLTLSSGYYYLVIKTPGSIQGKKIIKQ
jgi:SprB repeat